MRFIFIFSMMISMTGFSQEHARILERKTTYSFDGDQSVEIEDFIKVKILSEKGNFNSIYIDYTDQFRKIESVRLEVFDANNKKIKTLKRVDAFEIGFNPSYEINDAKRVIIDPEYENYPYTVVIQSRVKLNGFISLPTWVPRDRFNVAVDQAELSIQYPNTVNINFKEESISATQTIDDGKIKKNYKVANLPAIDNKIRFRDFYDEQSKVYISPQKFWLNNKVGSNVSWVEFGNWYHTLNNDTYELTEATKRFIDGIKKDDQKEVIKKIYEFMQDRTRYVSIQLGIGGFKSLPIAEVEKFGYGDCKALSTYMKGMLTYAGVKSNYILTRAGRDVPDVIADFPGNQFNHVYLGVPVKSDTLYLECTSQESPYNYTGTFTDDRNALWVDDNHSKIIRSRIYTHEMNLQHNRATVELDSLGNATIKMNSNNEGVFFDELMLFKAAPSDFITNYNQSKFNYSDFSIKSFKYHHEDRSSSAFSTDYLLHVNGLAKQAGSKVVLSAIVTNPVSKYLTKDDLMKYVSIKRGMKITDETTVNLPSTFWVYQLPAPESVTSKFGNYNLSMELKDNKLIVVRSFTFFKGDYRKADYEEFQAFFKKIEKLENRKLVLNSKT